MKAIAYCVAAALFVAVGTARADTFDPIGPELPDTIGSSAPYDLNGLLNGTSIDATPGSGLQILAIEFQVKDNATGNTENFADEFDVPTTASGFQVELPSGPKADSFTLNNIGFMLSPTQIPLDDLNFTTDPPPGNPGSTFTPLPGYDGSTLPSGGGTLTLNISTPLPRASWGLAVCFGGILILRRFRPVVFGI